MYTATINDMCRGVVSIDSAKYEKLSAFDRLTLLTDIINWASLERSLVGQTPVGEVRRGTEVTG